MLIEALKYLGTYEYEGSSDNPAILGWAKGLGIKDYTHDSIPWCGLFVAHVAKVCGKAIPASPLWALSWSRWGTACTPELGCIMTFRRNGGGHVGFYVGEDQESYHILGGNQLDQVSIARIPKGRFVAARCQYKIKPANIRKVYLSPEGNLSENEA